MALEPPEAFKSVPAVTLDHAFGADRAAEVAVACGSASPDQPFWLLHLRSGSHMLSLEYHYVMLVCLSEIW